MGAPLGNRNAAGKRTGSRSLRMFRTAVQKGRQRRTMSLLKGPRKQKKGKIYVYKEPDYIKKGWRP